MRAYPHYLTGIVASPPGCSDLVLRTGEILYLSIIGNYSSYILKGPQVLNR